MWLFDIEFFYSYICSSGKIHFRSLLSEHSNRKVNGRLFTDFLNHWIVAMVTWIALAIDCHLPARIDRFPLEIVSAGRAKTWHFIVYIVRTIYEITSIRWQFSGNGKTDVLRINWWCMCLCSNVRDVEFKWLHAPQDLTLPIMIKKSLTWFPM